MLAGTGDDTARAVWAETVAALADGLSIGVTLYDPGTVVIGGGLALAGPMLFGPLVEALDRRLTLTPAPPVVPAALGDQAGCRGAAELALDMMTRV
jgi:glucokinase